MRPQFEEGLTLDRFLMETARSHPARTGQFVALMHQVMPVSYTHLTLPTSDLV